MAEFCIYCGEPRGDSLSCCGENHFEEVRESDETEAIHEDCCQCQKCLDERYQTGNHL